MVGRWWGDEKLNLSRCALFVGLNPSTADETVDDPTIRREMDFAKSWGLSGLVKVNLFAYRATDPKMMKRAFRPIGPHNDEWIGSLHARCYVTVAAWGNHGTFLGRHNQVMHLMCGDIHCLGETKTHQPKHPLYLKKDAPLRLYRRRLEIT